MIINKHPGLTAIEKARWPAHLVGSRYIGIYNRDSDYDFLLVVPSGDGSACLEWMRANSFMQDPDTYGTDDRMLSDNVWCREDGGYPSIDLIVVSSEEAEMRLAFFAQMKKMGDRRGGLLAKAIKSEKSWGTLWECVAGILADNGEVGG